MICLNVMWQTYIEYCVQNALCCIKSFIYVCVCVCMYVYILNHSDGWLKFGTVSIYPGKAV